MARYTKWQPKTKLITASIALIFFAFVGVGTYNAPPTLTLADTAYASGEVIKTDDADYLVKGSVSSIHTAQLKINEEQVEIKTDLSFEKKVSLKEGDNTIKIEAVSEKGSDIQQLKIYRTTQAELDERARIAKEKEEAAKKAEKEAAEKARIEQGLAGKLYKVVGIVDGDTIKVDIDGKKTTIRFIGIDTPETKDPRKPVQCYGKEATSRMQHYVQSKSVRLVQDDTQGDKDKYDRLLRYVFLEDGKNVALEMIRDGAGKEYTYDKPYKHQAAFKEAQTKAKEEKKGLWAVNTCNGDTNKSAAKPVTKPKKSSESSSQVTSPKKAVPKTSTPKSSTPKPKPVKKPSSSKCDPNYTPCIPNVSYDLNCPDVGKKVRVIGTDHHRLDRDKDGYACESYG